MSDTPVIPLESLRGELLAGLENQLSSIETQQTQLWAEQELINRQLMRLYNSRKKVLNDIAEVKLEAYGGNVPWEFLIATDPSGDQPDCVGKALRKKLKPYEPAVQFSTYSPLLLQRTPQLNCYEKKGSKKLQKTLATFKAFLKDLLPGYKSVTPEILEAAKEFSRCEEGVPTTHKYVSLLTADLSESGIMHLRINEETNQYTLCKTTFGRTRLLSSFSTLDALVDRLAEFIRD